MKQETRTRKWSTLVVCTCRNYVPRRMREESQLLLHPHHRLRPPPRPPHFRRIRIHRSRPVHDPDMADNECNRGEHRRGRSCEYQRFAPSDSHAFHDISSGRKRRWRKSGSNCTRDSERRTCSASDDVQRDGGRAVCAKREGHLLRLRQGRCRVRATARCGRCAIPAAASGIHIPSKAIATNAVQPNTIWPRDQPCGCGKERLDSGRSRAATESRFTATARKSRFARSRTKVAVSRIAAGISCTRSRNQNVSGAAMPSLTPQTSVIESR